jgi:predicted nucleotidyltransferase
MRDVKFQDLAFNLDRIRKILSEKKVCKAILFGSAASGRDTRKSDLDLLIVHETSKRFFDRFDEFDEIYDVMKGRAVDLLIYTPEELQAISYRPFIKRIFEEGRTIYER